MPMQGLRGGLFNGSRGCSSVLFNGTWGRSSTRTCGEILEDELMMLKNVYCIVF